ncbi:hypothetical protein BN7_1915 [Wickerhamomyces ciferrii]|uniref:Uncharacterized protein n=1 Tax=Wickerhamomyces ciferrii (strain ATCC 14091 / BCRC 22168 / CBS 111 / JCM 3599 / NBRC 0793 / NRRL Y-1031 F-60-10) TaxID=1206466 RepID=K0KBH0_WICCF|nr:uncharacterized protein BN7_1915 [Wickerhamomyces ciferrii]CCH42370.1 hypothetical protein BN7_1915 [Wickerhamomyces ciferrii]
MSLIHSISSLLLANRELIIQKTFHELNKSMRNFSLLNIFTDKDFRDGNGKPLNRNLLISLNQSLLEEYLALLLNNIPTAFNDSRNIIDQMTFIRFYKLIFILPLFFKNNSRSIEIENLQSVEFHEYEMTCGTSSMNYGLKSIEPPFQLFGVAISIDDSNETQTEQLLYNMSMKLGVIEKEIDEILLLRDPEETFNEIFECLHVMLKTCKASIICDDLLTTKKGKREFLLNGIIAPVLKIFRYIFMENNGEILNIDLEKEYKVNIPRIPRSSSKNNNNNNDDDESIELKSYPGINIKGLNYDSNLEFSLLSIEITSYISFNKLITEHDFITEILLQMCCCNLTSCILSDGFNLVLIQIPENFNPKLILNDWSTTTLMQIDLDILFLKSNGTFFKLCHDTYDEPYKMKKLCKLTTEKTTPMLLLLLNLYDNFKNFESNLKDTKLPDLMRILLKDNLKSHFPSKSFTS